MSQDDANPPKHIDIRTRFEDNDAKVMFELKKYYNLTSWPAVIRFALAAAHREMIEKKGLNPK